MTSISGELAWTEVARELPGIDMEFAGDQSKRSSVRGRNISSWHYLREVKKSVAKEGKNRSTRDEEEEDRMIVDEEECDQDSFRMYQSGWEQCFGPSYGSFDKNTSLAPMRYTSGTIPENACCENVVQIFSVQVTEIKDDLEWPLHVYGYVAVRDLVDHNRNLLFERERNNCQILTQKDSYLMLTGPSRTVVIRDPVNFEIDLKVKGETESEDKVLSLKFFHHNRITFYEKNAFMIHRRCSSKRSTIDVKFAVLLQTVEATVVSAKVVGSWPDDLRGQVICCTASASQEDIVLLDSRDGRMPITRDGEIKLSRSVVSVELEGELFLRVVASHVGDNSDVAGESKAVLKPKVARKSHHTCDLGFCQVEFTVGWSLFTTMADLRLRKRMLSSK